MKKQVKKQLKKSYMKENHLQKVKLDSKKMESFCFIPLKPIF